MNPFKRRRPIAEADIDVVTWNVHHGTTARQLRHDLAKVAATNPTVILLQEFKPKRGHMAVFRKAGWIVMWYAPEFAVAWRPSVWSLTHTHEWTGDHEYWAEPKMLTVGLRYRPVGRPVRFTTYHTPAHVQRKDHGRWPNIWEALAETDATWDRKARRAARDGVPYIAGGDENVDLKRGWFPEFFNRLLTGAARPIDPRHPTHGKRIIDRFRVNRHVTVVPGTSRVIHGLTSDHNAVRVTFRIRWYA